MEKKHRKTMSNASSFANELRVKNEKRTYRLLEYNENSKGKKKGFISAIADLTAWTAAQRNCFMNMNNAPCRWRLVLTRPPSQTIGTTLALIESRYCKN